MLQPELAIGERKQHKTRCCGGNINYLFTTEETEEIGKGGEAAAAQINK